MPNNVYCALKFTYHDVRGKKIKEIKEYLKGENGSIDFNKIIPYSHDIEDGR